MCKLTKVGWMDPNKTTFSGILRRCIQDALLVFGSEWKQGNFNFAFELVVALYQKS
jgi:hypothetical protein